MTDRTTFAVAAHALPNATPTRLLEMARQGLQDAASERDGFRYANAHLAALRAAAAVVAARAQPVRGPRGPRVTSVWTLLAVVAPELAEWAVHFATRSATRAAAEAGIPNVVTAAEADEMVRAAEQFVQVVGRALGIEVAA